MRWQGLGERLQVDFLSLEAGRGRVTTVEGLDDAGNFEMVAIEHVAEGGVLDFELGLPGGAETFAADTQPGESLIAVLRKDPDGGGSLAEQVGKGGQDRHGDSCGGVDRDQDVGGVGLTVVLPDEFRLADGHAEQHGGRKAQMSSQLHAVSSDLSVVEQHCRLHGDSTFGCWRRAGIR